jgi:hypothetical protein
MLLTLLLFAVPSLATVAKKSWYLPQSNPGHYLNIASKMQVRHCPIILEKLPLRVNVEIVPGPAVIRSERARDSESPAPSIGQTISPQHRSPPSLFL